MLLFRVGDKLRRPPEAALCIILPHILSYFPRSGKVFFNCGERIAEFFVK